MGKVAREIWPEAPNKVAERDINTRSTLKIHCAGWNYERSNPES